MLFSFGKIKNIIIIGYSPIIEKIFIINKKHNLNTFLITSKNQSKNIKAQIDYKIFYKLDFNFRKFIKTNFFIKETLFISLSSRWIFNKSIINFFKRKLINFHSSRLPFFRGGATFSWQIIAEDRIHNHSIHFVTEKIDQGNIIMDNISIFPSTCQIPADFERYDINKLEKFYEEFIVKLKKKYKFNIIKQSENFGSYFPRIFAQKDGWIDWSSSSRQIYNFINSMDEPYDGAKTYLKQQVVKLKKVHIHRGGSLINSYVSGIIIKKYISWVEVACGDGYSLLVEKILNSKNQNIINKIKVGDRLVTPLKKINNAMLTRTRFGTKGFFVKNI